MWTGVYYPRDGFARSPDDVYISCIYANWDCAETANRFSCIEGPSYCVRLLVFNYEDCL